MLKWGGAAAQVDICGFANYKNVSRTIHTSVSFIQRWRKSVSVKRVEQWSVLLPPPLNWSRKTYGVKTCQLFSKGTSLREDMSSHPAICGRQLCLHPPVVRYTHCATIVCSHLCWFFLRTFFPFFFCFYVKDYVITVLVWHRYWWTACGSDLLCMQYSLFFFNSPKP